MRHRFDKTWLRRSGRARLPAPVHFWALLAGCLATDAPVQAAYTYWNSSLISRVGFETNPALRVQDPADSTSVQVRANLTAGYRLEDRWLEAAADLVSTRYQDEKDLSSDDFAVNLNSGLAFEHGSVGLGLRALHDTSLTSEAGPGGTGFVALKVPRASFTVQPFWRREMAETVEVSASYQFRSVRFDEDADTPLVDTDLHGLRLGLDWQLDERTQAQFTLQGGRLTAFDTPLAQRQTTDNLAGFAGIRYALSERATLSVDVGLAWLRSEYSDVNLVGPTPLGFGIEQYLNPVTGEVLLGPAGVTPQRIDVRITPDVGVRYEARLDFEGETWQAGLSVGRIGSPLSTGDVAVDNTASAELRWELSSRARIDTELVLSRRTADSTGLTALGRRDYVAFDVSYVRQLSEQLSFSASYEFVEQDFGAGSGADSHGVFATLTYRWDERPL